MDEFFFKEIQNVTVIEWKKNWNEIEKNWKKNEKKMKEKNEKELRKVQIEKGTKIPNRKGI